MCAFILVLGVDTHPWSPDSYPRCFEYKFEFPKLLEFEAHCLYSQNTQTQCLFFVKFEQDSH
jgi:hypothetical protein